MIDRIGGQGPLPPARPRARSGDRFSQPAVKQEAAVSVGDASLVSLSGMLAMQEAEADAAGDREARRQGEEMLHELAGLQHALLGNGVTASALRSLADLAVRTRPAADKGLRGVLDAIGLRVHIELSRYEADLKRPRQ